MRYGPVDPWGPATADVAFVQATFAAVLEFPLAEDDSVGLFWRAHVRWTNGTGLQAASATVEVAAVRRIGAAALVGPPVVGISQTSVGLMTADAVASGNSVAFRLRLPDTAVGRVSWTLGVLK